MALERLVCSARGHDWPDDGTVSQQCRRCGAWWHYGGGVHA